MDSEPLRMDTGLARPPAGRNHLRTLRVVFHPKNRQAGSGPGLRGIDIRVPGAHLRAAHYSRIGTPLIGATPMKRPPHTGLPPRRRDRVRYDEQSRCTLYSPHWRTACPNRTAAPRPVERTPNRTTPPRPRVRAPRMSAAAPPHTAGWAFSLCARLPVPPALVMLSAY